MGRTACTEPQCLYKGALYLGTMGTESFLGVKSGRGVTLTPHPLLAPFVKKE